MSARLVCDRLVLHEFPFKLDPLLIANQLAPANWSGEATFVTAITVRYTPNVSSDTPGQVVLAAFTHGVTTVRDAHAAACKVISPVWKTAVLVIPKDLLRFENWSRSAQPSLWLSAVDVKGMVDISCTLRCASQFKLPPPPQPPSLEDRLTDVRTRCYFGPILAGFSFVGCMPYFQTGNLWGGSGSVININLRDGSGVSTGNRYIRTPENKNYVAVRYGFGSNFDYVYTSANQNYSWKSSSNVVEKYTSRSDPSGTASVSYTGSWRPIKGNTSWWAEINPHYKNGMLNGVNTTTYYPCSQLIMYYEYPGVNIFSTTFRPHIDIEPGDNLPCPAGTKVPNKLQSLPLNHSLLQVAWNPAWRPYLNDFPWVVDMFETAKQEFEAWPTNCGSVVSRGRPSDISECEEGLDKRDDADYQREAGHISLDRAI